MQQVIDNPMTFGDYPCADEPVIEQECPRCHRTWEGYEVDGEIVWECGDYESIEDPVYNGMCPICAWKNRTHDDMIQYIERWKMQNDVLRYWLTSNHISGRACDDLWEIMKEHEPTYLAEIVSDYIEEKNQSDFVDWMLDGGANGNN